MTDEKPLISVAMCTYNGERYLGQQIDSVLAQDYPNIELIIVDDCSTDNTIEVLEGYAAVDSRIRLHKNPKNLGFIKNFEKALRLCRGSLIALCDQDDIWLQNKLSLLWEEMGDSLLIYSAVSLIDENGKPLNGTFPRVKRLEGSSALSLIFDNCVIGHSCLLRKELLDWALPIPNNVFSHDHWLAIIAAARGGLKASNIVGSLYRQHAQNTLLNAKKRGRKVSRATKNARKLARNRELIECLIERDILPSEDRQKLQFVSTLLQRNSRCYFNLSLYRFLLIHADEFLRLYSDTTKAARKISRGNWFYRLTPFL
ncbi:glycosyltransferase family 2 protein [Marinobacter sp. C2H3]|uniref:glycosyltransferase family 2 protein n=1 Tax=Marinobacter sp. C2H3 TaxID=3119003 RepID=UPI00300EA7DE